MSKDVPVRILVADSDARVLSAVEILLRQEPGPIVVRGAPDLDSLTAELPSFLPNLVLLDWDLPGRMALSTLFAPDAAYDRPKVIVLGKPSTSRTAALEAGADAFVGKDESPERLLAIFRRLRVEIEEGTKERKEL